MKSKFIIKHAFYEFRQKEVKLLFLMLLIASLILSSVGEINVLLKEKLRAESANLLGSDLVLNSSYPIDETYKKKAGDLELQSRDKILFYTMAVFKDNFLLVSVNAIEEPFPLKGQMTITTKKTEQLKTSKVPNRGELWADPSLMARLNVSLGDRIHLGEKEFVISGIVSAGHSDLGNFVNFSPNLYINLEEVKELNILTAGSRAVYQMLIAGEPNNLKQFEESFSNQKNRHLFLVSPKGGSLTKSIYRTIINFINIGMMFAIILSTLAISLACKRYVFYQLKKVALMRSFGHKNAEIIRLYLFSIGFISLFAILLGVFATALSKPLICKLLALSYDKESYLSIQAVVFSFSVSLLMVMAILSANVLKLKNIEPIGVFQRKEGEDSLLVMALYGVAGFVLWVAVYHLTEHFKLSLIFCYLILAFYLISWGVLFLSLKGGLFLLRKQGLLITYGFKKLWRTFSSSVLEVFALTSALAVSFSLWLLQGSLFNHWDTLVFKNTPNVFLININKDQVKSLETYLEKNEIIHSPIYPMVRGRLVAINGISVDDLYKNKRKPRSLLRELNLSSSETLADNNKIIKGEFNAHQLKESVVSVEAGMAKRVGIKLDDVLSFSVSGELLTSRVTSIRTVEWTSFNPNFFMIFNQGALKGLSKTFITSFYVKEGRELILSQLIKSFPNVTVIDLNALLNSVRTLLGVIQVAIWFIVGFSLMASMVIVLLTHLSFEKERQHDARIFSLFGLTNRKILLFQVRDSLFIGLISGVSISLSALLANYLLIKGILKISFNPPLLTLLLPVLFTCVLMTLLYYGLAMRRGGR